MYMAQFTDYIFFPQEQIVGSAEGYFPSAGSRVMAVVRIRVRISISVNRVRVWKGDEK